MCDLCHRRRNYQGVNRAVLEYVSVSEKGNVKAVDVIHARALISDSHNKTNKRTSINLIFFAHSLL